MATSPNNPVQTIRSGADKVKFAVAALLLMAGVVGFYALGAQGAFAQWGALLAALFVASGVFLASEPGKRLTGFGRDAVVEVKKVVWPTRKEAVQVTLYVFAFAVIMAIFLWLTDKTLEWVLYDLILGWRT